MPLGKQEPRETWSIAVQICATDGGEVRTTDYDHDALGHVLRETVGSDSETRVAEYRYEHPTYQRTLVRCRLDTAGGGSWIEESMHYDASGNPERTTDALGRTTTRLFDARDRMTHESALLGKTTQDQVKRATRTGKP
ncbi:MAG: hypothetical protein AMXMBFR59_42940 [Rhodanobacteraceae bacterium]